MANEDQVREILDAAVSAGNILPRDRATLTQQIMGDGKATGNELDYLQSRISYLTPIRNPNQQRDSNGSITEDPFLGGEVDTPQGGFDDKGGTIRDAPIVTTNPLDDAYTGIQVDQRDIDYMDALEDANLQDEIAAQQRRSNAEARLSQAVGAGQITQNDANNLIAAILDDDDVSQYELGPYLDSHLSRLTPLREGQRILGADEFLSTEEKQRLMGRLRDGEEGIVEIINQRIQEERARVLDNDSGTEEGEGNSDGDISDILDGDTGTGDQSDPDFVGPPISQEVADAIQTGDQQKIQEALEKAAEAGEVDDEQSFIDLLGKVGDILDQVPEAIFDLIRGVPIIRTNQQGQIVFNNPIKGAIDLIGGIFTGGGQGGVNTGGVGNPNAGGGQEQPPEEDDDGDIGGILDPDPEEQPRDPTQPEQNENEQPIRPPPPTGGPLPPPRQEEQPEEPNDPDFVGPPEPPIIPDPPISDPLPPPRTDDTEDPDPDNDDDIIGILDPNPDDDEDPIDDILDGGSPGEDDEDEDIGGILDPGGSDDGEDDDQTGGGIPGNGGSGDFEGDDIDDDDDPAIPAPGGGDEVINIPDFLRDAVSVIAPVVQSSLQIEGIKEAAQEQRAGIERGQDIMQELSERALSNQEKFVDLATPTLKQNAIDLANSPRRDTGRNLYNIVPQVQSGKPDFIKAPTVQARRGDLEEASLAQPTQNIRRVSADGLPAPGRINLNALKSIPGLERVTGEGPINQADADKLIAEAEDRTARELLQRFVAEGNVGRTLSGGSEANLAEGLARARLDTMRGVEDINASRDARQLAREGQRFSEGDTITGRSLQEREQQLGEQESEIGVKLAERAQRFNERAAVNEADIQQRAQEFGEILASGEFTMEQKLAFRQQLSQEDQQIFDQQLKRAAFQEDSDFNRDAQRFEQLNQVFRNRFGVDTEEFRRMTNMDDRQFDELATILTIAANSAAGAGTTASRFADSGSSLAVGAGLTGAAESINRTNAISGGISGLLDALNI